MPPEEKRNLPRLDRSAYEGLAAVHWIFNIQDRQTGWLTPSLFAQFQLISLHTFARYQILSPCICLMPDHIHLLLMGYARKSDQKLAVPFLRRELKPCLSPYQFQKTPYDHVLRREERQRGAFANMASYIRQNPARAGLVDDETQPWSFECCLIPGYPNLNPRQDDFWDRFWKIYYLMIEKHAD